MHRLIHFVDGTLHFQKRFDAFTFRVCSKINTFPFVDGIGISSRRRVLASACTCTVTFATLLPRVHSEVGRRRWRSVFAGDQA